MYGYIYISKNILIPWSLFPFQVQMDAEELEAMFPYSHMIPGAMHLAPFLQCYACARGGGGVGYNSKESPLMRASPANFHPVALGE